MTNRYAKVKAAVKAELDRLNAAHDGLRPSDVVAAAAHTKSPLHGEFEWDDSTAGHEYRLMQARKLIRMSVTVVNRGDGDTVTDRYVHIPPITPDLENPRSREGVYLRMSAVVRNDDLFARALSALVANLNRARQAAQELRDAAEGTDDSERLARIGLAVTALETAGAAVAALH